MRTTTDHEGGGLYYSDTEIDAAEVVKLGGADGINSYANEAVLIGKKECRRGGECALKAYVQCRDEANASVSHDMFVEFSCGEQTDLCPRPNTDPVDAALESLEEQARALGIDTIDTRDW